MRVAVNVEQLLFRSPGGTGRYTANLLSILPTTTPHTDVIGFCARHSPDDISSAFSSFGLDQAHATQTVSLPLPRPVLYELWHTTGHPRVDRLRLVRDADLVHAPSPAVPPTGALPLVVTVHDASFKLHPETFPRRGVRFHEAGVAHAAKRATLIITPSETSADEIVATTAISADQLRVVPNGVDHTVARPAEIAEVVDRFRLGDAPYVLWVGSLEPRKNVGTLVSAFRRLVPDPGRPGAPRLVLVGPVGWLSGGHVDETEVRFLGDQLRLLGPVSDADLRALFAGAVLFAFPSLHEGFGLPVLEAMVQGTPVVCSDIAALREVAGPAAAFVEARDVGGWATALEGLLTDPKERTARSAAGIERAGAFSWKRCVTETRAVYAEALGA